MKWQDVQSNWKDVRSEFHTKWPKLTDADLNAISGKRDELVKRLQKHYTMDAERAKKVAEDFVKTLH